MHRHAMIGAAVLTISVLGSGQATAAPVHSPVIGSYYD